MKKIVVLVTMITVLAGSVFAQGLPGTGYDPNGTSGSAFASPQSAATNGRIRSYADDYMRPDSFHNVNFDNWMGFASFQSNLRAALGYGTRLGKAKEDEEGKVGKKPVFLGLFYGGSAWANYETINKREVDGVTYFPSKVNTPLPMLGATLPYNQAAVLIGIANMGFRISFISTYKAINQKDFTFGRTDIDDTDPDNPIEIDNSIKVKSYEVGKGLFSPQLAWSMSKNLTKVGIRPWVTFDLDFYNDFSKSQVYNGNTDGPLTISYSNNYIQPIFQFGLGGITVADDKGWRTSVDLEYRARLQFYNNEFSYDPASGGNVLVSKVKGRNQNGNLDEYFWMDHRIRPSISTQWNGEKFRFRSKFDLNVELESSDSTAKIDNNGALISEGDEINNFIFKFNPDLNLAAQWQFAPKFFLNVGGRITIAALNLTTTKKAEYTNDSKNENSDSKTTDLSFGAVSNRLTLGVTINATDNLFLEASCGVGSNNVVDTFLTNTGFLTFGSILAGLKF